MASLWAVLLSLLCLASGCGRLFFDSLAEQVDAGSTGAPFSQAEPLGLPISADDNDDPTLTADLREVYFEDELMIWVARRSAADQPFGTPAIVAELSTLSESTNPEVSPDGLTIYVSDFAPATFVSSRSSREDAWSALVEEPDILGTGFTVNAANTYGVTHLSGQLFEHRRDSPGEPWQHAEIDSLEVDPATNAFVTSDGLELYFESLRDGDSKIYRSSRASLDAAWPAADLVGELDEPGVLEGDPWLSPTMDRIVFWRGDTPSTRIFYQATR